MRGANDPVGYRRGLVLGLTLAETLLLVLFILLLVYAALGQQRDKKMKEQEAQIAGSQPGSAIDAFEGKGIGCRCRRIPIAVADRRAVIAAGQADAPLLRARQS